MERTMETPTLTHAVEEEDSVTLQRIGTSISSTD